MNNLNSFFNGKQVLITGASGFIGSHLSKELLSRGAKVNALVRKQSNLWRLQEIEKEINIAEVDLLDLKAVKEVIGVSKPQYIFHFAIPSHSLLRNVNDLAEQINITNGHLINLFQSIKDQNIKLDSFIHACSGSVYRRSDQNYSLNELTPLEPATLRGMLKLSQRNICNYLGRSYSIPVRFARIFRAYGSWEESSKLIIKALDANRNNTPISLGNNKFKRDYIFIDDLVQGILMLAMSDLPNGVEMNFGSGIQYNASEIVSLLEQILGHEIPKQQNEYPQNLYDQSNFAADCSFAKQVLGWKPSISIQNGLKETVNWYKKHYND